jgi:GT2 family glycosyltransferase
VNFRSKRLAVGQTVASSVLVTEEEELAVVVSDAPASEALVEIVAEEPITDSSDDLPEPQPLESEKNIKTVNGTVAPKLVRKLRRFVEHKTHNGGIISVSYIAAPGEDIAFSLHDRFGNIHPLTQLDVKLAQLRDINLVAFDGPRTEWSVTSDSRDVKSGKNVSPEWALTDADTYFVASGIERNSENWIATATLLDPLTETDTPIKPLLRYRFCVLAATHRCSALLRLSFKDNRGEVLSTLTREVERQFRGGTNAEDYENIDMEFVAPAKTASLSIQFDKGRTEQKSSSYLFFARPSLQELHPGSANEAIVLSEALLEQARSRGGVDLTQVLLEAPKELFEGREARTDLCVQFGAEQLVIHDLFMENRPVIEITSFALENNSVSFSGRFVGDMPDELKYGVFVDGEISSTGTIDGRDQAFGTSVVLDNKHMDGCAHRIELRSLPSMASLSSSYELLPIHITPWSALQSYARAPLDSSLAPAARHHFRSFQAWLEKIQTSGSADVPALAALHQELVKGFNKRKTYPKLEFSPCAKPTVSVVIPVHNKFEVTYFCLCALQFAFNDTTFEVIVVDDGSSDETADIETYVSGIRVVKHKSALGFVHSCNDGAALATGEYVMFLNNDTEVTARWLDELLSVFRNFDNVGLVGSKLLYPDGRLQEAGGIVWKSGNPWNVGRNGNASDPRYNYLRRVDYLSGAAIMLPRDLWKQVGGFSPELAPAYFEDTDLAMKVRDAGRFVVYVPTSTVYHFEGQSAGTSTSSGMKRFQEVNRPKFKRKWPHLYGSHGAEGHMPDREKDRHVAFRVLFVDQHFPYVDNDAGSYAAFQEIRLFQSQGAKVTFLPRNLAWMDRHTTALERIGVECLYAPYVIDFVEYFREHASEYDVVYVCRYKIAEQVIPLVKSSSPKTKVILNLADLHFLRELREAAAGSPGYSQERAEVTRNEELAVVKSSDLTFSYSDVELAVLESHIGNEALTARLPWIVDARPLARKFADTKDILFLGGFGHPPNEQAVKFFAGEVMPLVRDKLPNAVFQIVGSGAPESVLKLTSDNVKILGYVPDLEDVFASARVFVAPLLAGAGLKGKVLEAMSRGVPSVLSPVAAEGTGLVNGLGCLVAKSAEEWAAAVIKLYTDEDLWNQIGANALKTAQMQYSFAAGMEAFREALSRVDVFGRADWGLVYKHARPQRYGL